MSGAVEGGRSLEFVLRRLRVVFVVAVAISGLDGWQRIQANPILQLGGLGIVACVLVADVCERCTGRAGRRSKEILLVGGALVLDVVAAILASLVLTAPSTETSWMPFVLPVLEAGLRYRLRGLISMWGAATVAKLAIEYSTTDRLDAQPFVSSAAVVLLMGVAAAMLAQLLFDELVALAIDVDRRAERTVLIVHLDGLDAVEQHLGRQAADRARRKVANRLTATIDELGGTVATNGELGFVVIRDETHGSEATAFVEIVEQVLEWPHPDLPDGLGFRASLDAWWPGPPQARPPVSSQL
jgi:GGDEF domain-containing protein